MKKILIFSLFAILLSLPISDANATRLQCSIRIQIVTHKNLDQDLVERIEEAFSEEAVVQVTDFKDEFEFEDLYYVDVYPLNSSEFEAPIRAVMVQVDEESDEDWYIFGGFIKVGIRGMLKNCLPVD